MWILNIADETRRLACWQLRSAEFEFDVVHRESTQSQAADPLAGLERRETDPTKFNEGFPQMRVSLVKYRGTRPTRMRMKTQIYCEFLHCVMKLSKR